ncbi:YbgC/FadM family acyl-CoA thioesterase [Phenylobacterium sp.]|uniref:YbgC/FadM family acyl-CoA thioesterase n=1 Tax=Phenylobacterium sp. TaxID=1871053 RepID=UPI0027364E8B|nr:YbgC/FadM family acyl-CoA thioesterase [Phenylobacterium sp.]MDP3659756.1 YbgC/FadM family acyl-CoA thioesterase [Phenylobacterium sp.]
MNEHPSAGRFDGREHRLAVRVYYEDTDFTGVVYHAAYVRYFERGRSDCLRLAGVHHGELAADERPTAFAVTRLEVDFLKASHIDDALEVRTLYERVRGARLFVSQSIWRGETLIATAEVVAACIDLAGRARKPSKALLDAVAPLLAEAP